MCCDALYIRTKRGRDGCELRGALPPLFADDLLDSRLFVLAQEALRPSLRGESVSEGELKVLSEVYKGLKELVEARAEALRGVVSVAEDSRRVRALLMKKYSKGGLLVKLGVACLVFPEPIGFSDVIGGVLIALGRGLERSSHLEDLAEAIRELKSMRLSV